ncbi:MAG TPA: hypothetical protein DCL43_10420 [Chitinophagaceae bacterium]|nr:hypothetical protein [Chitinophagaceae bacterium]HAN39625.1 hypothetical protein [Chitinophagaceae bacterium]
MRAIEHSGKHKYFYYFFRKQSGTLQLQSTNMYGFQQTIPSLEDVGPIIEAEVHSNEDTFLNIKNLQSAEPFCKVNLLIDTGSNISGLDKRFIRQLQLSKYVDSAHVGGVGGMHELARYKGILYLPIFQNKALPIDVIEGDYANAPYDGIIGRDVLRFCSFTYDGWSNTFKLMAIDI